MDVADGLPPPQRWRACSHGHRRRCRCWTERSPTSRFRASRGYGADPFTSIWVVNAYQLAVTVRCCRLPPWATSMAITGSILGPRGVYRRFPGLRLADRCRCWWRPHGPRLRRGRYHERERRLDPLRLSASQLGRGIGFIALVVATFVRLRPFRRRGDHFGAVLALAVRPQVPGGDLRAWLAHRFLPPTPRSGHPFDPLSAVLNAVTFGLLMIALDDIGQRPGAAMMLANSPAASWWAGSSSTASSLLTRRCCRWTCSAVRSSRCQWHRDLRIRRTADRVCRATVLLPVCRRPFADRDWPDDHALAAALVVVAPLAGRLSDRYSPRSLGGLGLAVMTLGLLLVLFAPAEAGVGRYRMADCHVRYRLRVFPVAQQPPDDRQRSA